ncbi:MAG TPA: chromosome partitioning protein ParB, partial [Solirubrobacteraceae bacterium]|nr:chromosome partitioning protein ParB [Solirubrobacteraceae bacterium]
SNLIRLLDLPDEAVTLIERRQLTEGHGRALLLAEDHGERRRLAAEAVHEGWSVRELEARARSTGTKRRRSPRPRGQELHPDQQEVVSRIADVLGGALGAQVEVTPAADGYRAALSFASLDDALEFARRIGVRRVA